MEQADKRLMILESARQCFIDFGYKGTTMELIAKTAKMGKGTFYNFFETKEAVFGAVIDRELDALDALAERTKSQRPVNEAVLLSYLTEAMAYVKKGDLFYKLGVEAQSIGTPETAQALARVSEKANRHLRELVTLFAEDKGEKDCDIALTSFLLMELYGLLVYRWPETHTPLTEQRIQDVFLKLYPLV